MRVFVLAQVWPISAHCAFLFIMSLINCASTSLFSILDEEEYGKYNGPLKANFIFFRNMRKLGFPGQDENKDNKYDRLLVSLCYMIT